jgi:uncharacterized Zn-finger protein
MASLPNGSLNGPLIYLHTRDKSYICTTCGKTFHDRSTFKKHVRLHTAEKQHLCIICGKKFLSSF